MKTKAIIIILTLSTTLLFSQNSVADKLFNNYAYLKASELYENAVKKGDSSEHTLSRLGDCYYNNSNSKKAALWYGAAVNKYKNINPEYIFKYVQTLKSIGEYEKAVLWLDKFKKIKLDDRRVKDINQLNLEIFSKLASTEGKYIEVTNMKVNSATAEFGGYENNGKFYFASARNTNQNANKTYKWNNQPYLNIYVADVNTNNNDQKEISNETLINSKEINTDYHEGTVAITTDGKTMYFTRDNVNAKNAIAFSDEGTSYLKLYKATLNDDAIWEQVEELPFNDEVYSTGHPALSPDNKTLYFVSDREGGYGQTDIYSVDILDNNTYGTPKNLGPKINTEGREMFPFIAKNNMFYFSSDGHLNLGLLDIFKCNFIEDKNAQVENLEAPFNSGQDDFAIYIDSDTETGSFSSNREQGKGSDDIYSFKIYSCKQYVTGTITNKNSGEAISNARVKLILKSGKVLSETLSDLQGKYKFTVACGDEYLVVLVNKQDHRLDSKELKATKEPDFNHFADLQLVPLIEGNEITIYPIFFDYNKSYIRPDAALELEHVVTVMAGHPKMHIKIESHTDSRGKDDYNLILSDRRAKATRDYIISRGITASRIDSAVGYGETQLVNKCDNAHKNICTEKEHQENRRSKFIITNEYD